jgi:hypothetical protein
MGFTTRVASGLGLTVVQRGSLELVSAAGARRILAVCPTLDDATTGLVRSMSISSSIMKDRTDGCIVLAVARMSDGTTNWFELRIGP